MNLARFLIAAEVDLDEVAMFDVCGPAAINLYISLICLLFLILQCCPMHIYLVVLSSIINLALGEECEGNSFGYVCRYLCPGE